MTIIEWRDNEPVPYIDERRIKEGVERAMKELAPQVVRIRYSVEPDWTGEPSVFFKIVLTDGAAKPPLRPKTQKIKETLRREIRPEELGLNDYFRYRSVSEQAELNEPSWA